MADIKTKRGQIETLIYRTMNALDPSGSNTGKYKAMFSKMNDAALSKWVTQFLADPKANIRLDIEEFDKSKTLKYENVEKAAKQMNLDLYEYVYLPHVSSNPQRPVRTRTPVLVGYLNIKTVQQLQTKKSTGVINDLDRDDLTGIAKGESKGGTFSGIENEILIGIGADNVLSEVCGVRGDNMVEYENMLEKISETGSCSLKDIKTNALDKPTLLKTDLFLKAMGIKTDIVSEAYYNTGLLRAQFMED
jgi:hypothetical protein